MTTITLQLTGEADQIRAFLTGGMSRTSGMSSEREDEEAAAEILEAAVKDGGIGITLDAGERIIVTAPAPQRLPALAIAGEVH